MDNAKYSEYSETAQLIFVSQKELHEQTTSDIATAVCAHCGIKLTFDAECTIDDRVIALYGIPSSGQLELLCKCCAEKLNLETQDVQLLNILMEIIQQHRTPRQALKIITAVQAMCLSSLGNHRKDIEWVKNYLDQANLLLARNGEFTTPKI